MGCGSSKVDDLPLVALCRERKELIRAAGDHRYALSAAHVDYFQSLKGIGEALHRFVNEELSVVSSPLPSSPVLTLPPSSETKNKSKNSSSSITTSLSHSLSNHSSPSESDSHLHFHSDIVSEENDHVEENTHMNYYYMRSSTAIPSMVYENPDPYPYYSMGGFYGGAPMEERPYFDMGQSPVAARQPSPPPPPPPEASGWDFLNPFDAFESVYSNYGYFDRRFGYRSSTSSPDSAQVRAREGIPDLEDEAAEKDPPLKEVKQVEKKGVVGRDFGEGTSKAAEAVMGGKEIETELPSETEKENKSSPPDGSGSKSTGDEENVRRKGVNFEVETSLGESTESSSRPSNITTVSTHQCRDLQEVVKEIKEQFKDASNYGKEVSGLLEAGKLRYRPRSPLLEALSCRIMDAITPVLTSSSSSSKQLNALKMAKARAGATERFAAIESSRLSSTLEKLYAWEKKLYKEVKVQL